MLERIFMEWNIRMEISDTNKNEYFDNWCSRLYWFSHVFLN